MNLNKKGFVLTETLMVTVFIVTIFTFIYTSIIPLFGRYRDMAEREQNIDIIYKLYGIRKFIKADKNSIVISQSPLKQITCADLENAYDCNMLLDYLELKDYELYYIRKISDSYNNSLISEEVQDYLKNYITDEKKKSEQRIMNWLDCSAEEALKAIKRVNKRRNEYFSYFTDKDVDDPSNYDIVMNVSIYGEEGAAKLIKAMIEIREEEMNRNK